MRQIYGAVRIGLAALLILSAALGVLLTSLIPIQIRGIPLTSWSVLVVVRLLCFVLRIRVTSTHLERIQSHGGLVFPNHTSALDVLALYHCAPMRFLAAHDVEHRPVIGWIARNIGTVFVTRNSPRSRVEARKQVAEALRENTVPPIVLFPEGRLGPGDTLFPFRHGAFGIAIEADVPYLPVAIRYTPLDVVLWRAAADGEGMWTSVWRMVQYTGRVDAELIPLEVVHPTQADSPKELAKEARADIAAALGLYLEPERATTRAEQTVPA